MLRARLLFVLMIASLASATTANARPRHRHRHRHRACRSEERVLGTRTCGAFGDGTLVTRLPPITLGLLAQGRVLDAPAPAASGGTLAREQQPGTRGDRFATVGPGIRLIVGVGSPLYAGFEGSGGFGLEPSAGRYGASAAIFGGRYRLERTTLGLELAAGVIAVGAAGPLEPRLDLDLRLRVDRWVSPWVTLGVFAGVDPFARDRSFGAQLAIHIRAFDGDQ